MKNHFYAFLIVILNILVLSCNQTANSEKNTSVANSEKQISDQQQNINREYLSNATNIIETTNQRQRQADKESQNPTSKPTEKNISEKFEARCGWFHNPTPANASLFDRDGEWIIGVQGGYQAGGDYPDFKPNEWVETNVHYGYGCACMQVKVDYKTHKVIKIKSSNARPLAVCKNDRNLEKPD